MSHKFDSKNKNNLFSEERIKVLPPEKILIEAGLLKDMAFADIGCGNGYFTLSASEIIGEKGKVFAFDISDEMLADLRKRAEEKNRKNIETRKSSENSLPIVNEIADIAFACNVIHEAKYPGLFIEEMKRILKPSGKIAVIDWQKIESDKGPPKSDRIEKELMIEMLEEKGFDYIELNPISDNFYFITAMKAGQ